MLLVAGSHWPLLVLCLALLQAEVYCCLLHPSQYLQMLLEGWPLPWEQQQERAAGAGARTPPWLLLLLLVAWSRVLLRALPPTGSLPEAVS